MLEGSDSSRSRVSRRTLPADVWVEIFGFVARKSNLYHDPPRGPHPILNIMLVCKTWMSMATPLLYRNLAFVERESLNKFIEHNVRREAMDLYPGTLVHSLTIGHSCTYPDSQNLISLLLHLPNMKSIRWTTFLSYPELDALAFTCSTTLLHIEMTLSGPFAPALAVLRRFTALQRVEITFAGEEDISSDYDEYDRGEEISSEDLGWLPALSLPRVSYLKLHIAYGCPRYALLQWLFRCRFQGLRRLHVFDLHPNEIVLFQSFLEVHGPHLEWLDLEDGCPELPIEQRFIPNVRHISYKGPAGEPALSLLAQLPTSTLHFHITYVHPKIYDPLHSVFDYIISGQCRAPLKTIHIDGGGFFWKHVYLNHPDVAGKWLRAALHLHMRGVDLLDVNGWGWNLSEVMRPGSLAD